MRRLRFGLLVLCFLTLAYGAWPQAPLSFVPINPCRLVDTRLPAGPLGGPSITGGTSRNFNPQLKTNSLASRSVEAGRLYPEFI